MGSNGQSSGFTIVEVMLFLALTGLLFLIGFFGTGNQLRNTRFTDSARSLHSFLQKQYTETVAGANGRVAGTNCTADPVDTTSVPAFSATGGDTSGTAQNCVVLGKMVKFTANSTNVDVYTVVGRRLSNAQITGNDVADIAASLPALSPQTAEKYTIQWGTQFIQPSSASQDLQTQAFAYLRSPGNGNVVTFAFPSNTVTATTAPGNDAAIRSNITTANIATTAGYCFRGGNNQTLLLKLAPETLRPTAMDIIFQGINTQNDCVR
jgi:Tfp pilus assembly protein FimT